MNKAAELVISITTEAAAALGHNLAPFRPMIFDDMFHSECIYCGAYTAVILDYNLRWTNSQKPYDKISNVCTKQRGKK